MVNVQYNEVYKRFELLTSINKRKPDWNLINQVIGGKAMPDTEVEGVHYLIIGKPSIIYTAHYDTAGDSNVSLISKEYMPHIVSNGNAGILGADDKAGATVLSFMIEHEVPGLYLFFGDEESGASQSREGAATDFYTRYNLPIGSIKAAIAFDRKGYSDVIQTQRSKQCCSMEYAETLSTMLSMGGFHYRPTDGLFTDTANMVYKIPECTNLSIGYFNQHTPLETQDILFLHKMVNFMLNNHKSIAGIPAFKEVEKVPVYKPSKYGSLYMRANDNMYEAYDYETGAWNKHVSKKKVITLPTTMDYLVEVSYNHVLAECISTVLDFTSDSKNPISATKDNIIYLVIDKSNYADFELELLGAIPDIAPKDLLSRIDVYSFLATIVSVIEANETVYICTSNRNNYAEITYSTDFGQYIFTNILDECNGEYYEEPRTDETDTSGVPEPFHI